MTKHAASMQAARACLHEYDPGSGNVRLCTRKRKSNFENRADASRNDLLVHIHMANHGPIFIGKNLVNYKSSKHINLRYHTIRHNDIKVRIKLENISTDYAD